jgi:hypothetical protein
MEGIVTGRTSREEILTRRTGNEGIVTIRGNEGIFIRRTGMEGIVKAGQVERESSLEGLSLNYLSLEVQEGKE